MFCAQTRSFTCATLILLNACVLFACKSHASHATDSTEAIAEKELGADFTTTFNESKTYALCQQINTGDHLKSVVKYVVIDLTEKSVANKGSFNPGYAKWITDSSIEVLSIPGIIRENQSLADFKKVITVKPVKN